MPLIVSIFTTSAYVGGSVFAQVYIGVWEKNREYVSSWYILLINVNI